MQNLNPNKIVDSEKVPFELKIRLFGPESRLCSRKSKGTF